MTTKPQRMAHALELMARLSEPDFRLVSALLAGGPVEPSEAVKAVVRQARAHSAELAQQCRFLAARVNHIG